VASGHGSHHCAPHWPRQHPVRGNEHSAPEEGTPSSLKKWLRPPTVFSSHVYLSGFEEIVLCVSAEPAGERHLVSPT
jgi:hypothetical protein